MKIIFMGTPDFSVGCLEALIESKDHEVVLVVTQPDRKKGRGKKVLFSPVKETAIKHNIPVFQPEKIREKECIEELKKYDADIQVVVAFGQILPKEILNMTKNGAVNVHASLLPAYRGAAPIQWAIIDGNKKTGVTTMQMDEGLDTGDMLLKEEVDIEDDDTAGSLHDKLMEAGSRVIIDTLKGIEDNTIKRTPQGDMTTSYAKMLTKEMGEIDFSKSAEEIDRKIRGLSPWPSAYTYFNGKLLKIWKAEISDKKGVPGQIISVDKDSFLVATKDGALKILNLQLTGKKAMDTGAFLRGNDVKVGSFLGKED